MSSRNRGKKADLASPRRSDLPSRQSAPPDVNPGDRLSPDPGGRSQRTRAGPLPKFPKALADKDAQDAEVVVTMGCGDTWPFYPGKGYLDW
jgi:hypothetical protein